MQEHILCGLYVFLRFLPASNVLSYLKTDVHNSCTTFINISSGRKQSASSLTTYYLCGTRVNTPSVRFFYGERFKMSWYLVGTTITNFELRTMIQRLLVTPIDVLGQFYDADLCYYHLIKLNFKRFSKKILKSDIFMMFT